MMIESIDLSRITFLTFILVFLAGVLTSFTPCVYPLIPVTLSFIGARSLGSKLRGFTLSFFYVLGLSMVYSGLGLFAALTGQLFGTINSHPITLILLANLYILLGLGMLGVFEFSINVPGGGSVKTEMIKRGKKDILASFLVGAVSALALGPCTAPVLGALLVLVGKEGNVAMGAILMLVFSFGLGFLLILIGTFAGLASRLPRSGPWMKGIKIVFALILLAASQFFLIQAGMRLF